jgi:hypothetical protein
MSSLRPGVEPARRSILKQPSGMKLLPDLDKKFNLHSPRREPAPKSPRPPMNNDFGNTLKPLISVFGSIKFRHVAHSKETKFFKENLTRKIKGASNSLKTQSRRISKCDLLAPRQGLTFESLAARNNRRSNRF